MNFLGRHTKTIDLWYTMPRRPFRAIECGRHPAMDALRVIEALCGT